MNIISTITHGLIGRFCTTPDHHRVDLWGGAVFTTRYVDNKRNGITMGNFININYKEPLSDGKKIEDYSNFDSFMVNKDSYMKNYYYIHEYGHVLQSRKWGILYIPVPGLFSIINCITGTPKHDFYWTEYTAVRYSYNYFDENGFAYDNVLYTK